MSQNRISAKQVKNVKAWSLPEVNTAAKPPQQHFNTSGQNSGSNTTSNGINVNSTTTLTAAEMENLTEQIYQEVYQEAYQAAKQQAMHDAIQQANEQAKQFIEQQYQPKLEAQLQLLLHIQQQLENFSGQQQQQLQEAVTTLSLCAAQSILQHTIEQAPDYIVNAIQHCLQDLQTQHKHVAIYVSEEDFLALAEHDLKNKHTVQVDKAIATGDCRIDNGSTTVEFSLTERFQLHQQQILAASQSSIPLNEINGQRQND